MNCKQFKESLYHFQQDELSPTQRDGFLTHADACQGCARTLAFEEEMLGALRQRLQPVPTPLGLETRVRAALADAAPQSASLSWFRRPVFAAMAASLLLAVIMVPSLTGGEWSSLRGMRVVSAVVTVIDPECASRGRTFEEQRRCKHHAHLNTLITDDGREWNISLDDERFRGLLTDAEMRGRRMRVRGNLFGAIQTLQLVEAEVLEETPNTL